MLEESTKYVSVNDGIDRPSIADSCSNSMTKWSSSIVDVVKEGRLNWYADDQSPS